MRKKLLIVEDDPFWRRFCVIRLRETVGLQVLEAADAIEAWKILARDRPSLILLDLILPGKDGFSLLEELKGDSQLAKIPVIVVSGLSHPSDRKQVLEMGAAAFLSKRGLNTLDRLIDLIKTHIS